MPERKCWIASLLQNRSLLKVFLARDANDTAVNTNSEKWANNKEHWPQWTFFHDALNCLFPRTMSHLLNTVPARHQHNDTQR